MTPEGRASKAWKSGLNVKKLADLIREVADEEREECAQHIFVLGRRSIRIAQKISGYDLDGGLRARDDGELLMKVAEAIRARKEKP